MAGFSIPDEFDRAYVQLYKTEKAILGYAMRAALAVHFAADDSLTACINDSRVLYGVKFFNTYPDYMLQTFVLCHEWSHHMLGHHLLGGRWHKAGQVKGYLENGTAVTKPYDHEICNIAFDYIVNDMVLCDPPRYQKDKLPTGIFHSSKYPWTMGEADVYVRVYRDIEAGNTRLPGKGMTKPGSGASDVDPSNGGSIADVQRENILKETLRQLAKSRGFGSLDIDRQVDRLLPNANRWKEIVRPKVEAVLGMDVENWMRPDRSGFGAGVYLPSYAGRRSGSIVLVLDSSGSIGPEEMGVYLPAMADMMKAGNPKQLIVLEVDDAIKRVTYIKNVADLNRYTVQLKEKGLRGGGGTSMPRAHQWMQDNNVSPDLTLFFTDGYTDFPRGKGTSKRVVWVMTTDIVAPPEAGETTKFIMPEE